MTRTGQWQNRGIQSSQAEGAKRHRRTSWLRSLVSWSASSSAPADKGGGDVPAVAPEQSTAPAAAPTPVSGASWRATDAILAVVVFYAVVLLVVLALHSKPRTAAAGQAPAKESPEVTVWASTQSGLYYCPETDRFGKGKGKYLLQREARAENFRPALNKPCQ